MKTKYSNKIYLDYTATPLVDSRVLEEMLPFYSEHFDNPSSIHLYGQKAEAALENSRSIMAKVFNCLPEESYSHHAEQKTITWYCRAQPIQREI